VVAGELYGALHIILNAGVLFEIGLDDFFSIAAADFKPVGEAESADAVDNAEVDGFGFAA